MALKLIILERMSAGAELEGKTLLVLEYGDNGERSSKRFLQQEIRYPVGEETDKRTLDKLMRVWLTDTARSETNVEHT